MKNLSIEVEGINCGSCVKKINGHFEGMAGIQSVSADKEKQLVEITCEDTVSNMDVRNDLMELGFTVNAIKKS